MGDEQVKRLLVILICILMISLTGCMKAYPLSETQTNIAAEYMAGLLLKQDKNYSPSLLNQQELIEIQDEDIDKEKDKEPVPTEAPKGSNGEDGINIGKNSNSQEVHYTLSEVINNPSFDIQYIDYKLADTYPEDESNIVFSVDPREGYQLLVVNFSVENVTDKDQNIDLSKEKIQYQLDINIGTIYKPQLALLENNLQYINMKVEAGKKIPAVLIFEVNKDIDMSDINLIISRDSKTEIIEIK